MWEIVNRIGLPVQHILDIVVYIERILIERKLRLADTKKLTDRSSVIPRASLSLSIRARFGDRMKFTLPAPIAFAFNFSLLN